MKTVKNCPFSLTLCALLLLALISDCASNPEAMSTGTPKAEGVEVLSPSAERLYKNALQQMDAGESEKAERTLLSLAKQHAAHSGIWVNLATAHYRNGDLEQAEEALEQATHIDGNIANIDNLQGLIATERGQYPAAEKHFLAAIEKNTEHANSHYNLALLYDLFYQDLARALKHYERYLSLVDSEDPATLNWVNQIRQSLTQEVER